MTTEPLNSQSEKDALASDILALFTREPEAAEYFRRDEDHWEALRVCTRVAVDFAFFLRELPPTVTPSEPHVDYMNDTIRSALEFFEDIRDLERVLATRLQRHFEWRAYESPGALKVAFLDCFGMVTSEGLSADLRMYYLLLATRLELIFWATTFV